MTETLPSAEVAAGVTDWLSAFGDALAAGGPGRGRGPVHRGLLLA